MSANEPTPEELLGHVDWVRALARRLVGDDSLAEDIAQETWLAASQAKPAGVSNVKAWLAGIARNRARMAGRSRSRRQRREALAARPEALESTAELAERASLQKDLLGRVLELEEPLRAVVLLRYFDELAPPAIAERLGLPLKTVHSRMARALGQLRVRLDGEYGDRGTWALAFVPLMRAPAGATTALSLTLIPLAAGALMNTKALVAASVAAVLICGYGLYGLLNSDGVGEAARPADEGARLERGVQPVAAEDSVSPLTERAEVAVEAALSAVDSAEVVAPPSAAVTVSGRVLSHEGRPVAGVDLVLRGQPDEVLATSDSGGVFEIELAGGERAAGMRDTRGQFLLVQDPDWVTLRGSSPGATSAGQEELVIVAPSMVLRASVVDADGSPIEGAALSLNTFSGGMHAFPYRFEQTTGIEASGVSDESGRLEIERFPGCSGLMVSLDAEGYDSHWGIRLDKLPQPYVFELIRVEDAEGDSVQGIVLDPRGFPVADAKVVCGNDETRSDSDGLFRLNLRQLREGVPLCAVAEGHQPALIADLAGWWEARGRGPIELMLGPEPVALSGRLVNEAGEPQVGWEVHMLDETALSTGRIPVVTAEGLTRGLAHGSTLLGRLGLQDKLHTDGEGRFAIEGLYPREYRVRVVDGDTLTRADTVLMAGNGEQQIEVGLEQRGPVAGTVVDRNGNRLQGVELVMGQWTFETDFGSMSMSGAKAVTDAEGRFELGMAPMQGGFVGYSGEEVMFGRVRLDDVGDIGRLELVVPIRRHFKIELADAERANSFQLLDEDLNAVQVNMIQVNGMSASNRGNLVEGRSQPLSVADSAIWIVLEKDGEEVERERLVFSSEELTTVRL